MSIGFAGDKFPKSAIDACKSNAVAVAVSGLTFPFLNFGWGFDSGTGGTAGTAGTALANKGTFGRLRGLFGIRC